MASFKHSHGPRDDAFNEYRVFRKGKVIKGETRRIRNAAKRERRARR